MDIYHIVCVMIGVEIFSLSLFILCKINKNNLDRTDDNMAIVKEFIMGIMAASCLQIIFGLCF